MKPDRHTITDALLSMALVACVLGAMAITLTAAYKAGYRDATIELTRGKPVAGGRITKEEIEQRNRQ